MSIDRQLDLGIAYDRTTGIYTPKPDHIIMVPTAGRDWLSANVQRRQHWRTRSAGIKKWREAAGLAARESGTPTLGPSHVIAELYVVVRRTHRLDPANWAPTAKACIDGAVDAGIWPDDSSEWVTGPDMRLCFRRAETPADEALRLLIWGARRPAATP